MGGHLGLLSVSLELGSGKLLAKVKLSSRVRDWAESAVITRSNSVRNLRAAETYADVRVEGVKQRLRAARQPNKGCAA